MGFQQKEASRSHALKKWFKIAKMFKNSKDNNSHFRTPMLPLPKKGGLVWIAVLYTNSSALCCQSRPDKLRGSIYHWRASTLSLCPSLWASDAHRFIVAVVAVAPILVCAMVYGPKLNLRKIYYWNTEDFHCNCIIRYYPRFLISPATGMRPESLHPVLVIFCNWKTWSWNCCPI